MHHSARTLTRYASDSPRPLNWSRKKKVRFQDEADEWLGWEQGYGVQWGFDGHGRHKEGGPDTRLLALSRQVLLLLEQCDKLLIGVTMDTSFLSAREQESQEEQYCMADVTRENDVLDIIELYISG